MPLNQDQIIKIYQKEAYLSDALKRDATVNYYEGWFFVTLNTRAMVPVLSICVGDPSIPDGAPNAPHCQYTKVGQGVIASWKKMSAVCSTVETDMFEAMPEHFHGLVHLLPGNKRHLGSLISGFMAGCTHAYWDTLGIEWRNNRNEKVNTKNTYGKRAYTHLTPDRDNDHTHSFIGPALFTQGYNDVEPITPEEVEIKRAYIRDQARKRIIQGDHHQCFVKHRNNHSSNWTLPRILSSISSDRFFHNNLAKCQEAQQRITARLNPTCSLDYLGNYSLLTASKKLPLVCHRSDASLFDRQKALVLTAARNKAIIVSAFISPKERDIRDQLMTEQLPFIEIMDNGFSDRYKPTGKAFYAIAENRLLQITPWSYVYQKNTTVSREQCLVMNELARVISGVGDDWWKSSL